MDKEHKSFSSVGIVVIACLIFSGAFIIGLHVGVESGIKSHSMTMIEMKKAIKERYFYCPYCGQELHYYYDYPYREGVINGME